MTVRTESSNSASTPKNANAPASRASISPQLVTRAGNRSRVSEKYGRFNFCVIALYQIVMRTGWIFKTESVIMPAVLDSVGGTGWLRGLLPPLNRFGQSIPPLLAARKIKNLPRKKYAIAVCASIMGICFLALALLWLISGAASGGQAGQGSPGWLKYVFLMIYGFFFICVGVNQLALGTLDGKLIAAERRGRLMSVANIIGAITAIGCAWYLLRLWLRPDSGNFTAIFGFAGGCFLLGALVIAQLREPRDRYRDARRTVRKIFSDSWRTIRQDRDFARLTFVAAAFGTSMVLFPHYQALARENLNLDFTVLITWVIIQNIGTGLFSIPAGLAADRFGNRFVLRIVLMSLLGGPILALLLTRTTLMDGAGELGGKLYPIVFLLVGLTPINIRVFNNYALELTSSENHPRYLSTLSLCMAAPVILLSPWVGWLVDLIGFESMFLAVVAIVLVGWCVTFGIREPRRDGKYTPNPSPSDSFMPHSGG